MAKIYSVKQKINWVLVLLILFSAFTVRFFRLDKVPASLFYDEIDLGYQVRSLLSTGKDYRNTASPFFFRSMNTDKTPFPIYFSAIPSLLFKSPAYQVRAGAALAGVISLVLAMILAYQLTGKKLASLVTGLVFSFSPWQIQFSRIAFEAIFMQMVFLASISTFLFWRAFKKPWLFFLSAILLGLNVYTYRIMSLFAPLTVLLLFATSFKEIIKEGWLKVSIWFFLIGVMILPFLYSTTIASVDQPRINQISIFSDPMIPITVQRHREVDSNDYANPQIGKHPVLFSYFFHNKVVSYMAAFGTNYYKNFSTEFLFLKGDPNGRHSPDKTGVLLSIDIIGLVAGLVFVIMNLKDKKFQLLLALLFLAPIPSDLTVDGATHASRLMIMSGPLLIIVSLGYASIISLLAKEKKYWLGIPLLFLTWLLVVVFYFDQYFIHYPIESSRQFGYGYKEAINIILEVKNQYKKVRLTGSNDPPMLYYLYWSNTSPKAVQNYGVEFGETTIKGEPLDFVKPIYFSEKQCEPKEIEKLDAQTIYLATYGNLPLDFRNNKDKVPTGIKLIDVIKYPDNEVAYYLITRDTKNGVSVMPSKASECK